MNCNNYIQQRSITKKTTCEVGQTEDGVLDMLRILNHNHKRFVIYIIIYKHVPSLVINEQFSHQLRIELRHKQLNESR